MGFGEKTEPRSEWKKGTNPQKNVGLYATVLFDWLIGLLAIRRLNLLFLLSRRIRILRILRLQAMGNLRGRI